MKEKVGQLSVNKHSGGEAQNVGEMEFGLALYVELEKDGWRKNKTYRCHKTLKDFKQPTLDDYAEAFELMAKQIRERKND